MSGLGEMRRLGDAVLLKLPLIRPSTLQRYFAFTS
jgi:hypothetical protein